MLSFYFFGEAVAPVVHKGVAELLPVQRGEHGFKDCVVHVPTVQHNDSFRSLAKCSITDEHVSPPKALLIGRPDLNFDFLPCCAIHKNPSGLEGFAIQPVL
jgi:hypothetical protein